MRLLLKTKHHKGADSMCGGFLMMLKKASVLYEGAYFSMESLVAWCG
jgi:hypothetical protein